VLNSGMQNFSRLLQEEHFHIGG